MLIYIDTQNVGIVKTLKVILTLCLYLFSSFYNCEQLKLIVTFFLYQYYLLKCLKSIIFKTKFKMYCLLVIISFVILINISIF